jgi:hypothetical protein
MGALQAVRASVTKWEEPEFRKMQAGSLRSLPSASAAKKVIFMGGILTRNPVVESK